MHAIHHWYAAALKDQTVLIVGPGSGIARAVALAP
jgi:hypothetical protein